ncbi:MAG: calcium/proton exchanger [Anaerolineales bacterium]|nr:calcium/proton exchanger [Anaerolineales bacterium]
MKAIQRFLSHNPLVIFLLSLPLTLAGELLHWPALAVFILTCIGIIPMAAYIGKATESLAHFTGPRIGGLLNATLGNAAELIITVVAIRAGLLELVKASITGSILGNLLLVMGFSFVVGGLKHGRQVFDKRSASRNAILLVLAVLAMLIPSLFSHSIGSETSPKVEALSLGVAAIMISLYVLGLLDAAKSGDTPVTQEPAPASVLPKWSVATSIVILVLATAGIVWLSEVLVGVVEPVVAGLGVSEFFLGIILIPIIGNASEPPGGCPVRRAEQNGAQCGNCGLFQPANRPAGGTHPGLPQPGARPPVDTYLQYFRTAGLDCRSDHRRPCLRGR